MEELLHYIWKHKIYPIGDMRTVDGKSLEIINPGIQNTNAGPDFFSAKIKIDGTLWVGNVEIHVQSSDWYRHHHDKDSNYENVILHVAGIVDCDVCGNNGKEIPQLALTVPDYISNNYDELLKADKIPRCANVFGNIPRIIVHNWLSALQVERLEMRTEQIMVRLERCNKDWEWTFFTTLARNLGFGINGDAFEQWAYSIHPSTIGKHRDNLFQIEALFFGQAGMLDTDLIPVRNRHEVDDNEYFQRLRAEYKYLKQKFLLKPMEHGTWKLLRLRPQNFPYIRIAQIAMMYYEQRLNFSKLLEAETAAQIFDLLNTHVSDYWRSHYTFASQESAMTDKNFSEASKSLIAINSVVPIMFAYGKYKADERLCERSLSILEGLKPENNKIIRAWREAGCRCDSAADSQAILQLNNKYCDNRDCLRCRFGYEFIRNTPGFMREKE